MQNPIRTFIGLLVLVTGWAVIVPSPVMACSVCFGETDAPIADGLGVSILFLIGVTYLVIGSGAFLFWQAHRRALREREI